MTLSRRLPRTALALITLGLTACSGNKADATPVPAAAAATAAPAKEPIPGLSLDDMLDSDRRAFWRMLEKYPSACGKAQSLEASLRTDPKCKRSIIAAKYILRLFAAHLLPSEVEETYEQRFSNVKRETFDLKNAPLRGDASAPVTLVEFSDFQCPHCKHLQPVLEKLLKDYKGQIKLYFKNYPISAAHPDAATAGAAALAAGKQGKFWEFHDKIFASDQQHEDMNVLQQYAKDLKLDLNRWRADIEPMKAQVDADHADGVRLDIDSTPTLYINGRKQLGPKSYEEIKDWIDEELAR